MDIAIISTPTLSALIALTTVGSKWLHWLDSEAQPVAHGPANNNRLSSVTQGKG
ncbi:hypothetical protein P7K49_030571, partial [Saguinus oedipus]